MISRRGNVRVGRRVNAVQGHRCGASEVRILFVFDPARNAVILVGGDTSGDWSGWYRTAIKTAEDAYEAYRDGKG
ncbi:type II toxin-antitoxin system RelE/ParE family toxin [Streptomyces sp. P11-1]|uniref:type II toxin-antitoxin system RelE/ParE family toxin n=1 Tax=Streptomyces sp. P11-1 TaxID=3423221 RepID=UPI003D2EEE39